MFTEILILILIDTLIVEYTVVLMLKFKKTTVKKLN